MGGWLRAFVLLGLLVATPFIFEYFFGARAPMSLPDMSVSNALWRDAVSYSGFGFVVILLLGFLAVLLLYMPKTYEIAEYLTLAEREMNSLLRGWGGGLGKDPRKEMALERAQWLQMIPVPKDKPEAYADLYKLFFETNQKELAGGSQGDNMGKARYTAFLLREIYEVNVKSAQLKIFNDYKISGKEPYIAPGVRQIVGYEKFNLDDIKNNGFPPGAGVDWFPLWLTVKLNRYPRDIIMVKPGKDNSPKVKVYNWDVLQELTTPQG